VLIKVCSAKLHTLLGSLDNWLIASAAFAFYLMLCMSIVAGSELLPGCHPDLSPGWLGDACSLSSPGGNSGS
jgi:hypothetical protein